MPSPGRPKALPFAQTLAFLLLLPRLAAAQSVGSLDTYTRTAHGLRGHSATADVTIEAYSPNVIRVRVTRVGSNAHRSYALADNEPPSFSDFSLAEHGDLLELRTSALTVQVVRRPRLQVRFLTPDGQVINEDLAGDGLGTTFTGEKVTVYKALQQQERFVGLGEELGDLDRRGSVVTLKNTDNYRYDDPRVPMYVSIPFFIGTHHRQQYGLFFNNSYRSVFNFGASNKRFASFSFDGGDLDEFFLFDDSVPKLLAAYTELTGRTPLPPKWSLGFQQSRSSYSSEAQVMFIARSFRAKHLPIDGIVLDADYLYHYEPFRLHPDRFADIRGLASTLQAMHIELTASINPGITVDDTYAAYRSGRERDVFLRFADGELYTADIAPNTSHFPDFSNPRARDWWIENMKLYHDLGIRGYWNDMNEPAIDGQAMPDNVLFDYDGQRSNALEAQNVYGLLMARSSYEAFRHNEPDERPFVLSRSGFAGIQRYAAVWSGDNQAKDEHILLGALLSNVMGLSGVPLVGPDIGGYIGDGNRSLFRRWIEVGAFSPYLRAHREQFAAPNEPWSYGEEAEGVAKAYVGFRYRLLPYLYAVAEEASRTGLPIQRSLVIDSPFEPPVYEHAFQYQFLFGPSFLVNPMTSQETTKTTYLPPGTWYNVFTDERLTGGHTVTAAYPSYEIPIFVRGPAIIPMQRTTESVQDDPGETLDIHVFAGAAAAQFDLYDDDGHTWAFSHGEFFRQRVAFDPAHRTLTFHRPQGTYATPFRHYRVILHGFAPIGRMTVNGRPTPVLTETIRMLDPYETLAGVYTDPSAVPSFDDRSRMRPQQTLTVPSEPQILLHW